MAAETIEAKVQIIEFKPDGKYILLAGDMTIRQQDELKSRFREWLSDSSKPVMVMFGDKIQLVDADEIKEVQLNGKAQA